MPVYGRYPTAAQTVESTTSPDDLGECQICRQIVAVEHKEDVVIVVGHRADNATIVACAGSGYVPRREDDRDEIRARAIRARKQLLTEIGEMRAEMAEDYVKWNFATFVDYYASRLIPLERQAEIWKVVAYTGDLWKAAVDCFQTLSVAARNDSSTETAQATIAGTHAWLIAVRRDLANDVDGGTFDREQLHRLLMGV